jgi:hypothetical protein
VKQSQFVLIRSTYSGVHCGMFVSRKNGEVVLKNARRVWRWRGANTLHELSLHGAAQEYTRISDPVPQITVLGVIELIPCSPLARTNLEQSRWAE